MSAAVQQHQPAMPAMVPQHLELVPGEVHRLSPAQIREAVASLVQQGKVNVAVAICEASLALHPQSEDLLVISSLVAEMEQNWPKAEALLVQLAELQSPNTTGQTWLHLARVLRCQSKFDDSWLVLDFACSRYPDDAMLKQELQAMSELFPVQLDKA